MKRVLINGASGKLGQIACQAVEKSDGFELVAKCGTSDDLAKSLQKHSPDIAIDTTTAKIVFENAKIFIDAGVQPIIGTSGLLPEQIKYLQEACATKQLGGIIAPNFSLGAIMAMKLAQQVAPYFEQVEILEMHHEKKLDAPSGTAIKTADMLKGLFSRAPESHETLIGARGATYQDIPIHSVRLPGILAREDILFGHPGETFTISHNMIDRKAFIPGIRLALRKVSALDKLVYGLESLL